MTTQVLAGSEVAVDDEGFMTDPSEWSEDIAGVLARNIAIDTLTDDHWKVIRWLREDFEVEGETATLRRVSTMGGVPIKQLYTLFPKKPAKKMSYVAGLPKPKGCV